MFDRFDRKLDKWAASKPRNMLSHFGFKAGAALGFLGGLTYDAIKFVPSILDQTPSSFGGESIEAAAVLGLSTAIGAVALWRAGAVADNFIHNPDRYN